MKLAGITQTQVDAQKAAEHRLAEIAEMTAYLASTDWYATRLAETGKAIPEEILKCRQGARDWISEIKKQEAHT
jgi:hypothetical protein